MLEVSSYNLPSASVSGCVPCDLSDLLDAAVSGRDRGCGCGGRGRVAGRGCGCDKARTSGTASVGGNGFVRIVWGTNASGARFFPGNALDT